MKIFVLVAVLSAPPTKQDLMIAELYETDPVLAVEVLDVVTLMDEDRAQNSTSDLYLPDDRDTSFRSTDGREIEFESGPDAAYEMLLDMVHDLNTVGDDAQIVPRGSAVDLDAAYDMLRDLGISPVEADDVVIEAMSILSFEFQELTILQFNPREYTFTK